MRRTAGGQSPPLPGGPGREEYGPGWTRFCHSSAMALPPSDPVIQASLTTTHVYTSLHAALPVPEAWLLLEFIRLPGRDRGRVFSLRRPLPSGMFLPLFLLSDSPGPPVCFRLNPKPSWSDKKPYLIIPPDFQLNVTSPRKLESGIVGGTFISVLALRFPAGRR